MHRIPEEQLKFVSFLAGGSALALNLSTLVHELGHAVAMWGTGGSVKSISLHPFAGSYTHYANVPDYPKLTTSGGILLGAFFGFALLVVARLLGRCYLALLFTLIAVTALIQGGAYALGDAIWMGSGDTSELIRMGVPKAPIILASLCLIASSLVVAAWMLRLVDFRPKDSPGKRCCLLFAGMAPYALATLIYHALIEGNVSHAPFTYIIGIFPFMALVAALSWRLRPKPGPEVKLSTWVSWKQIGATAILGSAMIVAELLIF